MFRGWVFWVHLQRQPLLFLSGFARAVFSHLKTDSRDYLARIERVVDHVQDSADVNSQIAAAVKGDNFSRLAASGF